jgi:hypothetical protein
VTREACLSEITGEPLAAILHRQWDMLCFDFRSAGYSGTTRRALKNPESFVGRGLSRDINIAQ